MTTVTRQIKIATITTDTMATVARQIQTATITTDTYNGNSNKTNSNCNTIKA